MDRLMDRPIYIDRYIHTYIHTHTPTYIHTLSAVSRVSPPPTGLCNRLGPCSLSREASVSLAVSCSTVPPVLTVDQAAEDRLVWRVGESMSMPSLPSSSTTSSSSSLTSSSSSSLTYLPTYLPTLHIHGCVVQHGIASVRAVGHSASSSSVGMREICVYHG